MTASVDSRAAAATEMNADKRKVMIYEIQKVALEQAAVIPLFYADNRTAMWDYGKDFKQLPTANYRLWESWVRQTRPWRGRIRV